MGTGTNSAEYLAGTNPTDAKSAFKLTRPETGSTAGVKLRFQTVLGKQYIVESCNGLGAPWSQVGGTVNGTEGEVVVTDSSVGAANKFYRIRMVESTTPAQ